MLFACRAFRQTAGVDESFASPVERHAQAVHQLDDLGCPVSHFFDRRLVIQKVTSVDRVVEVFPLIVAELPSRVIAAVDAALRANAMRTFDRGQTDQIDLGAQLGQLHR